MSLSNDLNATIGFTGCESLAELREDISDTVIKEALKSIKSEQVRRRGLPSEVVIWLVIGMALLRDRCISAVATHLGLLKGKGISSSAITQARDRLGEQAMEAVFAYTADEWALRSAEEEKHRWRGLAMFAIDGTCLRVPDSVENEAEFGRPSAGSKRGQAGYPQLRLVAVMAARSHLLLASAFGKYRSSESSLAAKLWYLLPDNSLTFLDRGFVDYSLFHLLCTSGTNRHFLCRAKKGLKLEKIKQVGRGDMLVKLTMSRRARKETPSLPETIVVRAVQYQRRGYKPQMVLTSLTDAELFPIEEMRELYHERWEIELGYDEIKTHTLEREEALRSKRPDRVRQEIWGLLTAYNLVRRKMEQFAEKAGVQPLRISYRNSLLIVRNTINCASTGVGSVRKLLHSMDEQAHLLVLPPRRNRPSYTRHVKIKMSNYLKNPGRLSGSTKAGQS
jgi:hypothetical protein